MSSPITFSGFNSIDFNSILEMVMQQERAPLTTLETQKSTLATQSTTFATFASKLASFETALGDLGGTDSLNGLKASSSDTAVGVATTSGRTGGTYEVVVSQLARAQVTASASTYASSDATIASAGTLSLLVTGFPPVDIDVTGTMSLKQLAEAINSKATAPVTASVVQAAPGAYRLVLTGRSSGTANGFTLTSSLTGGAGVTFADPDNDGLYGEVGANSQEARDAKLTVNSLEVTSSSNTVTDVVPGATLTLSKEDPGKTVVVSVSRDNSNAAKQIETLVTRYNEIATFLKDQSTAAASGKASIAREPLLKSLKAELRTAMLGVYPEGGTYSGISRIGLEFDRSGKLLFKKAALEDALTADGAAVQKLFSGADGTGGVLGALKGVMTSYTSSGGLIAAMRDRLDGQVTRLGKRLDTMELQLSIRRSALQKEYLAADQIMSQLKAQSSSLGALGNQYRLF